MTRDIEKTTPFVKDPNGSTPADSVVLPKMFSHFDEAKHVKLPKWAGPLLGAAAVIHVIIFVSMWIKTIWDVEQLDRPKNNFDIAIAPPPHSQVYVPVVEEPNQ